jgi:hypothetical protein
MRRITDLALANVLYLDQFDTPTASAPAFTRISNASNVSPLLPDAAVRIADDECRGVGIKRSNAGINLARPQSQAEGIVER